VSRFEDKEIKELFLY